MKNPFRIKSLKFNDGTNFELGNVTVLVGPNNSGKSRALKDTVALSTDKKTSGVVVSQTALDGPSNLEELVEHIPSLDLHNRGYILPTLSHQLNGIAAGKDWRGIIKDIPKHIEKTLSGKDRTAGLRPFMTAVVAHLPTDTRLTILGDTRSPENANEPKNLVQYFYRCGTETERVVSNIVNKFFKKHIRLDFTDIRHLRMRYGSDFDDVPPDPRDALVPMQRRALLSDQGDGVRSFTGLLAAIYALDRPINVIDEPEAFLHPPQAFHIGRLIGQSASTTKQFVLATHSSDILRGLLSASQDVAVVRINRTGDTNSFRKIETATLQSIVSDPLLSSSRVLEGLFYSSAVVVESDSDARFFSASFAQVNNELDAHFVAADNKQTVAKVLKLYSKMGVQHLGIVDFDMLRVGAEFEDAMKTLSLDQEKIDSMVSSRKTIAEEADKVSSGQRIEQFREVLKRIETELNSYDGDAKPNADKVLRSLQKRANECANVTKPWKELKEKGREGLSEDSQEEFDAVYDCLLNHGLCIYPLGELEASLVEFGLKYTTNKKEWIVAALTMITSLTVDDKKRFWKVMKQLTSKLA